MYAQPSTEKKDFVTKRLRTQLASSQLQHQSPSNNKCLTLHQFNILSITESRLLTVGLLIVTWCCYNSFWPPYVRS